ncbi:restriction endonuclease [Pseudomonas sp. 2822-15]|uniref:HsdM family class I SAM-dependent methyltransferase n=1 Tax=Pseudomonas sp. 2822-15 TaxID=1712677 RepID=UPI000C14CFBB|nr:N-6 DNA methylase [Pseudomonas sp. 2822-15]PIB44990.1 restriction endonuclease [Pseudomonas sp. 2822-15]
MSKNERKTENIVREELRHCGFYDPESDVQVDEQKSNIEAVKRALKVASKSGGGGTGAPEFIISAPSSSDFLVVVECKADVKDHASNVLDEVFLTGSVDEEDAAKAKRTQRYAVDGVLHYAKALAKDFNVISVAISGETKKSALLSTYLWPKGSDKPKELKAKDGATIDRIIPWADYIEHATFDPTVKKLRFDELMSFAADLHEFMRDHAKLTESEKPLLVSGTLIALRSPAFAASFGLYSPSQLQKEWMRVIQYEIQCADLPQAKKDNMTQPYSSIAVHPELGKPVKSYPKGALHELIDRLKSKVWPFIGVYHDFDVVGQFYGEFLKYTGGDKKALGIVLTPRHTTELFAYLANVSKDSKVLDICAGTGGFLISAMHRMFKFSVTELDKDKIRKDGLVGVEQQPNMFALAASNMILRGDGKANLYQGSCFDDGITLAIKKHNCDVGMVNPPYSQSDSDLHELRFVKHMLDCLKVGGTGIAIVPMGCALSASALRAEIMRDHTLEAVMSMPDELFYPVGVITCIMVFTAHKPHAVENRKTWFGYWKRDGYTKTKHKGRVDPHDSWPAIRDRWVDAFRNREVHAGESVLQKVTAEDEWCAEAYMDTDYSKLSRRDFEKVVRDYAVYRLLGGNELALPEGAEINDEEGVA